MPVMDGIEATKIISSFRDNLPVIAITAYARSGEEHVMMEAGCVDYVSKPFNKEKLLELIRKHM